MEATVRASLLWGLVGGLSFLVLLQGYHLYTGTFVGIGVMLGTALVVMVVTAVLAHWLRPTLRRLNERT